MTSRSSELPEDAKYCRSFMGLWYHSISVLVSDPDSSGDMPTSVAKSWLLECQFSMQLEHLPVMDSWSDEQAVYLHIADAKYSLALRWCFTNLGAFGLERISSNLTI